VVDLNGVLRLVRDAIVVKVQQPTAAKSGRFLTASMLFEKQ
jgi:hypothetical protein